MTLDPNRDGRHTDSVRMNGPAAFRPPSSIVQIPGIAGYKLIGFLGQGSYGKVWRAEAPGGIEVAIKLVKLGYRLSENEQHALEVTKTLKHPFLVQVHAFWEADETLVIVMEVADGSLEDRGRQCESGGAHIPVEELTGYLHEIAEALDYLHDQGRLHRDVKPANILLVKGHAKLGDFGLARLYEQGHLDVSSTLRGTPLYMAPEVWQLRVGPRSDLYSLAATYVELRRNRPLFEGKSHIDIIDEQRKHPPRLNDLPKCERQVLLRALALKPSNRFQSCLDFARALREAVEEDRRQAMRARLGWRSLIVRALVVVAILGMLLSLGYRVIARPSLVVSPPELHLAAGDGGRFYVNFSPAWLGGPVKLTTQSAVSGVSFSHDPWADARQHAELNVSIDPNVQPGVYPLALTADRSSGQSTTTIQLHVDRANVLEIPEFTPAPEARLERIESEKLVWSRIKAKNGCVFLLIPWRRMDDPSSFYIMEDKVTREFFRQFAEKFPERLKTPGIVPTLSGKPQLPVTGISIGDACEFAKELGGRIPSRLQWDKAAGALEPDRPRPGPFAIADPGPGDIAINFPEPIAAGTAPADRSTFGCRDMAGNGREWTRDLDGGREAPLATPNSFSVVYLRGRKYSAPAPLRFDELADLDNDPVTYTDVFSDIGFRVVVEIAR